MKNFVLLLLLANVLFLVWQFSTKPGAEPGVVVVSESGPGNAVTGGVPTRINSPASVGAVLGEGQTTEIAAAVGRVCVSIGPYQDLAAAATARGYFEEAGIPATVREDVSQAFVGYWVQVRNIPDVDTERANLEVLRTARLGEAYAYEGDDGMNISIGVFEQMSRAETVKQQVEQLGLFPDISQRYRSVSAYFVDAGLPAGTAIDDLSRRFGEKMILQGNNAACPAIPSQAQ